LEEQNVKGVLRVFAMSLAGPEKCKAYAIYDGQNLVITHIQALTGEPDVLERNLLRETWRRQSEGFLCIGEALPEPLAYFARQFILDGENRDAALETYLCLAENGNIIVAPEYPEYMPQPGCHIRTAQGEDIGVHRVILLCVAGSMISAFIDRITDELVNEGLTDEQQEIVKLALDYPRSLLLSDSSHLSA